MNPTKKWLAQYEVVREKTASMVDFNLYFKQPQIAGKQLAVMKIGPCSIPTGHVLVRDPLVYLGDREEQPYLKTAPVGTFETEVCVVQPDESGDCARYAAVRLRFSEKDAIHFEEALIGNEDLTDFEDESYFGFCVDAGLGCICDQSLHKAFCDFSENWEAKNPDGNLYDDYFSDLFEKNQSINPQFQRENGDWLNWEIPDTSWHMPIFQSGFGDGVYPVYWGYASDGTLCQLVVQLIDIELAYGKPSGRLDLEDFKTNEELCEGEIELEDWDDLFQSEGPYRLIFNMETNNNLTAFTEAQKAGYDFLMENAYEMICAVLIKLLEQWPNIQCKYSYDGQSPEERQREIPEVVNIDGFFELLKPIEVIIYDQAKDGLTYTGITFSCTWDIERGFGAMLCGNQVVEIGGMDTALLSCDTTQD